MPCHAAASSPTTASRPLTLLLVLRSRRLRTGFAALPRRRQRSLVAWVLETPVLTALVPAIQRAPLSVIITHPPILSSIAAATAAAASAALRGKALAASTEK